MGVFFRQRSSSGALTNLKRASALNVGKKSVISKKVNELSFTNRAVKRSAKKYFLEKRSGGLEKKEAIDFLVQERGEHKITRNNAREVGYEMGLTKGDMKKVFSAKSQEGNIKNDIPAKKEMPSNVIKFQSRKTTLQKTDNIDQSKPTATSSLNNRVPTKNIQGNHFVSASTLSNFSPPAQVDSQKSSEGEKHHTMSVYDIIRQKNAANSEDQEAA